METVTDAYVHQHKQRCHNDAGGSIIATVMESSWWSNVMFMHGPSVMFKPTHMLKTIRVMLGTAGHRHSQRNNSPAAKKWLCSEETALIRTVTHPSPQNWP